MAYWTDSDIRRVPPNAIGFGHQHNSGKYYLAMVITDDGLIPGKALPGNAWCGYKGKETFPPTDKFVWICTPPGYRAELVDPTVSKQIPNGALKTGCQLDCGDVYAAVAHTEHGDIPCKVQNGECFYPYRCKEWPTSNFSYVVLRKK